MEENKKKKHKKRQKTQREVYKTLDKLNRKRVDMLAMEIYLGTAWEKHEENI